MALLYAIPCRPPAATAPCASRRRPRARLPPKRARAAARAAAPGARPLARPPTERRTQLKTPPARPRAPARPARASCRPTLSSQSPLPRPSSASAPWASPSPAPAAASSPARRPPAARRSRRPGPSSSAPATTAAPSAATASTAPSAWSFSTTLVTRTTSKCAPGERALYPLLHASTRTPQPRVQPALLAPFRPPQAARRRGRRCLRARACPRARAGPAGRRRRARARGAGAVAARPLGGGPLECRSLIFTNPKHLLAPARHARRLDKNVSACQYVAMDTLCQALSPSDPDCPKKASAHAQAEAHRVRARRRPLPGPPAAAPLCRPGCRAPRRAPLGRRCAARRGRSGPRPFPLFLFCCFAPLLGSDAGA